MWDYSEYTDQDLQQELADVKIALRRARAGEIADSGSSTKPPSLHELRQNLSAVTQEIKIRRGEGGLVITRGLPT